MSISHEMREAAERTGAERARVTLTRVRKGEQYTASAPGGFVRKAAAVDGVLIGDGDAAFFVATAELRRCMR